MVTKLTQFVQESRKELKKVNWPSREETIRFTVFVIVLSILIASFLGALDFIFLKALEQIIS
jgi:preprotein translocase subunit SecE